MSFSSRRPHAGRVSARQLKEQSSCHRWDCWPNPVWSRFWGTKGLILYLVDHIRFIFAHRGVNMATDPHSAVPHPNPADRVEPVPQERGASSVGQYPLCGVEGMVVRSNGGEEVAYRIGQFVGQAGHAVLRVAAAFSKGVEQRPPWAGRSVCAPHGAQPNEQLRRPDDVTAVLRSCTRPLNLAGLP
jgi:hypothetical protein